LGFKICKFTWDLGILIMSILFLTFYLYKFHLLKQRITEGKKIINIEDVFFISNGTAERKLNGYLLNNKIKDSYIFSLLFLFDLFLIYSII